MKEENKTMTPQEVFEDIKNKRVEVTKHSLSQFYESNLKLAGKYIQTGQLKLLSKLKLLLNNYEKELELLDLGINTYVYRDDVTEFLNKVENKSIVLIELENYPRDIPNDIVETITKTKDIVDKMYVLFTDYTGETRSKVQEERRDKDPILFGIFRELSENGQQIINDRFYFLGDWEDEYCDLTMDKFLSALGKSEANIIETPLTEDEIITYLNSREPFKKELRPVVKKRWWRKWI